MKPLLAFITTIFFVAGSTGQIIKYKAYEYTTIKQGQTTDPIWKETNLLVVFDVDEELIKVYGKEEHTFNFIKRNDCIAPDENKFCVEYIAIDNNGEKATVTLMTSKIKTPQGKTLGVLTIGYKVTSTLYMLRTQ